jgi:long-subunit acyl-CoA synthetase (AMP-forming)
VFVQSPLVMQAWVYGNSDQSCIVAVIVPDADPLTKWAAATLGKTGVRTNFSLSSPVCWSF